MKTITYTEPTRQGSTYIPDNCTEVLEFIGPQPPCPICGGYGEYESEYGPKGCNPCNSRLIGFIDHSGKLVYANWGDTIERHDDGLHLAPKLAALAGSPASTPMNTPELGIYDHHENNWIGNTKGPARFTDWNLALIAIQVVRLRDPENATHYAIQPIPEDITRHLRDDITRLTTTEALNQLLQ